MDYSQLQKFTDKLSMRSDTNSSLSKIKLDTDPAADLQRDN